MASRVTRLAVGTLALFPLWNTRNHSSHSKLTDLGGLRARPVITSRPLPALFNSATRIQHASSVPTEDPKKRAQSIIDSLPGSNLISKTAIVSAGAGLSIFGISNEFLVINEESVVAFCLLSVFWAIGKYGGPMYAEWAEGQTAKIKGILNAAREEHTTAVQKRIDNVKQLGGVVDVTKDLFEVSKVRLVV